MFNFTGNKSIEFSAKILPSESYNASKYYGDIVPYMFFRHTDPPFGRLQKIQALVHSSDNCPVNLFKFPTSRNAPTNQTLGELAVLSDTWQMYVFNIDNFRDTRKVKPFITDGINTNHLFPVLSSAHPIQEYNRNTFITILSELNPIPFQNNALHLVRILSNEEREILLSMPIDKIAYMHSFGLSINYAVLFQDPLFFNLERSMETANVVQSLDWDPLEQTTIIVINLINGYIFRIPIKPGFHVHQVNTYEEHGHLITDFVTYPDPYALFNLEIAEMKNATTRKKVKLNGTLIRYDIHLKKERVKIYHINPVYKSVKYVDLPSINEAYRFKKYCYIYAMSTGLYGGDYTRMGIVKKDLCHGKDLVWSKTYHYVSEPTFVANPDGKTEDDGVLLTVMFDGTAGLSYVLILDAKTFDVIEGAYLPTYIPTLIHGRFFKQ